MINAGFQSLKQAEQRKGHADLKEDQYSTSGLAPNAGPKEG
jgi:hypothetical protein